MDLKEIQIIKLSWRLLQNVDPVIIGNVFYSKLFLDHPQLKSLFIIPEEAQSKKLVDMLNIIVGRVHRLNELSNEIAALAIRHVQYGVKAKHYKSVTNALLWTLQQGLGEHWTNDACEAWKKVFAALSETMIRAAYRK